MDRRLKLIILPKSRKKKEFSQSLNNLARILEKSCSVLKIDEPEESLTINVLMEWETEDQMYRTFKSNEFTILSGAISALCEKIEIRFNNSKMGDQISKLNPLLIKDLKPTKTNQLK